MAAFNHDKNCKTDLNVINRFTCDKVVSINYSNSSDSRDDITVSTCEAVANLHTSSKEITQTV